jgi:hypothetical protein
MSVIHKDADIVIRDIAGASSEAACSFCSNPLQEPYVAWRVHDERDLEGSAVARHFNAENR